MSAEIVNLRRARKGKRRADEAAEAAANRVRFGRTREARHAEVVEMARAERHLDGHRLAGDRDDAQGDDGVQDTGR